jgi:hypothetical protein
MQLEEIFMRWGQFLSVAIFTVMCTLGRRSKQMEKLFQLHKELPLAYASVPPILQPLCTVALHGHEEHVICLQTLSQDLNN